MAQPTGLYQLGSRNETAAQRAQTFALSPQTDISNVMVLPFVQRGDGSANAGLSEPAGKLNSAFFGAQETEYGINFLTEGELEAGKRVELIGLDMRQNGICTLTPELFDFRWLSIILLANNQISQIPAAISRLRNLQIINLSCNKIGTLPKEIGRLCRLRELYLGDNNLEFLPVQMGCLYQLRILSLEGNPLKGDLQALIIRQASAQEVVMHLRNSMIPKNPELRPWMVFDPQEKDTSHHVTKVERSYSSAFPLGTGTSFTVMCYNILCSKYATSQMYFYCPVWALEWNYRKSRIMAEIQQACPDVLCLQELEMAQFEESFNPELAAQGYLGGFYPKSRSRTMNEKERRTVDGCAIFYNAQKYALISQWPIEFSQLAAKKEEFRRNDEIFNRVFTKDNIAYAVLLEDVHNSRRILIVNVHIHWDPAYKDVKLVQTIILMEQLENISTTFEGADTPLSVVICGDFNSTPDSGVYEFMNKGTLGLGHPCFNNLPYEESLRSSPMHRLKLKDAYAAPNSLPFTNFTATFTDIIDYIWYSDDSLKRTGLLGLVDEEHVENETGFPNAFFPSDHIPLMASFRFV